MLLWGYLGYLVIYAALERETRASIRVAFRQLRRRPADLFARGHDSWGDECVRSTTPGPQSKVRLCQYPVKILVSIE